MVKRVLRNALIVSMCAAAGMAGAATPYDVANLVGEGARVGDQELRSRGYVHIETQKGADRSWSMWWQPSSQTCITVATTNGRFESITTSPPIDCNQHHTSGGSDDNAAAALAIGAVAVIGAIALSHKSHHHSSNNSTHYDDHYSESEFERGHRDGLYNHFFDNRNRTDAYAEGYRSGVEQRDHDSSYRVHSGHYDRGYTAGHRTGELADLNGRSVSSAHATMRDWGFWDVDTMRTGSTTYTIWYKRSSGQCIQMTEADGTALDVRDIGHHPACR